MFKARPNRALFFALLLTLALHLPSLIWPVISDDEGIFDAIAQVINRGGVVYRDALVNHPPGKMYLYAFLERLAGAYSPGMAGISAVHLFGIAAAVLTALGLWLVALELLPLEFCWIPPALYGFASTAKSAYDGLAVNGELLMNLPTVFAVWLVIRGARVGKLQAFLSDLGAGALIALAGLSKWQALIAGLAFPFFLPRCEDWPISCLRRGAAWLAGLSVPLFAVTWFFFSHQAGQDFLRWGGLVNLHYISEGYQLLWTMKRFALLLCSAVLPAIALYGPGMAGFLGALRKRGPFVMGLVVWTLVSLFAVTLGGRFFGHYLLQAELPLSLLGAAPLVSFYRRMKPLTVSLLVVPGLFFLALASFPKWTRALYDPGDPDWERIGREIAAVTAPEETLFIWGNVPPLYFFSGRVMGTRFSYCNNLTGLSPATPSEYDPSVHPVGDEEAWRGLWEDLEKRRPDLILDTSPAAWKGYGKFPVALYPGFSEYIAKHYRVVANIRGSLLYRRNDGRVGLSPGRRLWGTFSKALTSSPLKSRIQARS